MHVPMRNKHIQQSPGDIIVECKRRGGGQQLWLAGGFDRDLPNEEILVYWWGESMIDEGGIAI